MGGGAERALAGEGAEPQPPVPGDAQGHCELRQQTRFEGVGFMWGIVWSYINHGGVEGMVRVVCRGGANVDYRAAGAGGHGNLLVEEGEEGLTLENIWGRRPIPSEGSRKEGLCRRVIAEGAEEETEGLCLVGRSVLNEGDTVPMDSVH